MEHSSYNEEHLVPVSKDYKKLYSYQKALILFDITAFFVENFLRRGDRTVDQMKQAARSGKQNIAEGSILGATSKQMEINLINVSKGSFAELAEDYEDYVRTRRQRLWEKDSKEVKAMKKLAREPHDSEFYMDIVRTRPPEVIANMAICLLKQVDYLLAKHLQTLEKQFLEQGGFKERMTSMRIDKRNKKK
jgi:four helix bundle suffix protein